MAGGSDWMSDLWPLACLLGDSKYICTMQHCLAGLETTHTCLCAMCAHRGLLHSSAFAFTQTLCLGSAQGCAGDSVSFLCLAFLRRVLWDWWSPSLLTMFPWVPVFLC
jgi:hypothetical protein